MAEERDAWCGWAIVELMGHRRVGGYVQEEQIAGATFLRVDVETDADGGVVTEYYHPQAVYSVLPCGQEEAEAFAAGNHVWPVSRWEMGRLYERMQQEIRADIEDAVRREETARLRQDAAKHASAAAPSDNDMIVVDQDDDSDLDFPF